MGRNYTICKKDSFIVPGRTTVVIPTYNYGHFLSEAIDSVLRQKDSDIEVIVVDDGSTDETQMICHAYRDHIRYLFQSNAGLSAARNNGIKNATGQYIVFLDADDLLGRNVIQEQKRFFHLHPDCKMAVCKNRLFNRTENGDFIILDSEWRLYEQSLGVHLCYFNIAPPHAYMVHREVLKRCGLFDTDLKACEDYDLWLRAAFNGYIPVYNPSGTVFYRKHPNSMSANSSNQIMHDALLHYRLAKMLASNLQFPFKQRFEGVLAFAAGALKTAIRLQTNKLNGWLPLMHLVKGFLTKECHTIPKKRGRWNALSCLFYLRVANSLSHLFFRERYLTKSLRRTLRQFTRHATGTDFKASLLRNPVVLLSTVRFMRGWPSING